MIIKVEADGQACLDTGEEKKASLDIVIPQSNSAELLTVPTTHPALRNIDTRYASSISTASGSLVGPDGLLEETSKATSSPTILKDRRRRILWLPLRRPRDDPGLSGSAIVPDPEKLRDSRPRWWSLKDGINKRWLFVWLGLSLGMCFIVAISVWMAMKSSQKVMHFPDKFPYRPPDFLNMYTFPPGFFACTDSDTIYNGSRTLLHIPFSSTGEHTFSITGGATGMLTMTSSPNPEAQDVTYDFLIKGDVESLKNIVLQYPQQPAPASSDFAINTPHDVAPMTSSKGGPCVHFDITMYIPRGLRKLEINIDNPLQLGISPLGHIELDELLISLKNTYVKVDVHEALRAANLTIELQNGLLNGAVSIGKSTQITNVNGETRVTVIPNPSPDWTDPSPALLSTHTSTGRTCVTYVRNLAYRKRQIVSYHMASSQSCVGELIYVPSGFDGMVFTDSSEYNITNAKMQPRKWGGGHDHGSTVEAELDGTEWAYSTGNKKGPDRIYIQSGKGKLVLP